MNNRGRIHIRLISMEEDKVTIRIKHTLSKIRRTTMDMEKNILINSKIHGSSNNIKTLVMKTITKTLHLKFRITMVQIQQQLPDSVTLTLITMMVSSLMEMLWNLGTSLSLLETEIIKLKFIVKFILITNP